MPTKVYLRFFIRSWYCEIGSDVLYGMYEAATRNKCFAGIRVFRGTEFLYVNVLEIDIQRTFSELPLVKTLPVIKNPFVRSI